MIKGIRDMAQEAAALAGLRILVVEDDYLVAQVLVDFLEDAGAEVVGPIGWTEEAVAFLTEDGQRLDRAVLDINLHGTKSYPVADALIARSVRFVFTTGYGVGVIDGKYAQYPRCEKPFSQGAVIAALAGDKNGPRALSPRPPSPCLPSGRQVVRYLPLDAQLWSWTRPSSWSGSCRASAGAALTGFSVAQ